MKLMSVILLLIIALSHCTSVSPQKAATTSDSLTIRTGTSFGMCVGYCLNDYVFNGTSATLTQSSNKTQTQYPTKTCQFTISEADWRSLKSLTNWDTFSKQPVRFGCPDCADGGAEYIELQLGEQKHRVTFEAGNTIPGFEALVEALSKQREAFKECK